MLLTGIVGVMGTDWWVSRGYFWCSSRFEIALVHVLTDLGWYKRWALFTAGVFKVNGPFACVALLSCNRSYGGVHG